MAFTREDLISNFYHKITEMENKSSKDRTYVLDLLAEIACALNGDRPKKPVNVDPATREYLQRGGTGIV